AGVPAAHGDDDVSRTDRLVGHRLRKLLGQVKPHLRHRLGDRRVDVLAGRRATGANVDSALGVAIEQGSGHLRAAGIVDADKEHFRGFFYDASLGQAETSWGTTTSAADVPTAGPRSLLATPRTRVPRNFDASSDRLTALLL